MKNCNYCANIISPIPSSNYREPWDNIIHETANFVITPTVGAMIEGWSLVISKRHALAIRDLNSWELRELNQIILQTREVIKYNYGEVIVFEHGPAHEGTTIGCGVDHAHMHVVPLCISLIPLIEAELDICVKWEPVVNLEYLSEILHQKESYLYVWENLGQHGYVAPVSNIPSQFIRRIIARAIGFPALYDYRRNKFAEHAAATFHKLKRAFASESHQLAITQ